MQICLEPHLRGDSSGFLHVQDRSSDHETGQVHDAVNERLVRLDRLENKFVLLHRLESLSSQDREHIQHRETSSPRCVEVARVCVWESHLYK